MAPLTITFNCAASAFAVVKASGSETAKAAMEYLIMHVSG
jgi:hypothetical protein